MAASDGGVPHPLLKDPVLFMEEVPKRVGWKTVIGAFSCCGTVLSAGKYNGPGESKTWIIRFVNIFEGPLRQSRYVLE